MKFLFCNLLAAIVLFLSMTNAAAEVKNKKIHGEEILAKEKYNKEIMQFVFERTKNKRFTQDCLNSKNGNLWDIDTIILGAGGTNFVDLTSSFYGNDRKGSLYQDTSEIILKLSKESINEILKDIDISEIHPITVYTSVEINNQTLKNVKSDKTLRIGFSYKIESKNELSDEMVISHVIFGPEISGNTAVPYLQPGTVIIPIPFNHQPSETDVMHFLKSGYEKILKSCIASQSHFGPM